MDKLRKKEINVIAKKLAEARNVKNVLELMNIGRGLTVKNGSTK